MAKTVGTINFTADETEKLRKLATAGISTVEAGPPAAPKTPKPPRDLSVAAGQKPRMRG
jgi:hypothetical protein